MSSTISANMNLIIPTVGQEPGPDYATDINASLSIIDQHTHAAGSGVPITPAALDINTNLTINSHFLTDVAGLVLVAQSGTPAINTLYESGVDLYFVDGNGNNIRITQSGGIAGSPGTIANLTSPASASYVSGSSTFVWQSNTNIAANMDAGSLILRNLSPNSTYGVTLEPPAALSLNYTLTLPSLPLADKFMVLSTTGAITGGPNLSGGLTTTNLSASAGILGSQLSATAGITGGQIASSAALSIASLTTSGGVIIGTGLTIGSGLTIGGTTNGVAASFSGSMAVGAAGLTVGAQNVVISNTNATKSLVMIRANFDASGAVGGGEGVICTPGASSMTFTYSTALMAGYVCVFYTSDGTTACDTVKITSNGNTAVQISDVNGAAVPSGCILIIGVRA